jgi:transposase
MPDAVSARNSEIKKMHRAGMTQLGISKQIGCSVSTVSNVLKRDASGGDLRPLEESFEEVVS